MAGTLTGSPRTVTAHPCCPLEEAQGGDAFLGSSASHPHCSAAQALRGVST